jgi:hypothetical protein
VASQSLVVVVGPHYHGHGIPAHQGPDSTLHEQVAGHHLLVGGGNRVAERGGNRRWQAQARIDRVFGKFQ